MVIAFAAYLINKEKKKSPLRIGLVEAVHLIDVREINHIGGNIKNRQKERQEN